MTLNLQVGNLWQIKLGLFGSTQWARLGSKNVRKKKSLLISIDLAYILNMFNLFYFVFNYGCWPNIEFGGLINL